MDDSTREFVETFQRFLREVVNEATVGGSSLTPLGQTISEFLAADVSQLPMITRELPAHRLVDADLALAELDRLGQL